jgi:hypothetical protein
LAIVLVVVLVLVIETSRRIDYDDDGENEEGSSCDLVSQVRRLGQGRILRLELRNSGTPRFLIS